MKRDDRSWRRAVTAMQSGWQLLTVDEQKAAALTAFLLLLGLLARLWYGAAGAQ